MGLSAKQFDTLVDEHGPAMYRVAVRLLGNPHDAEDVVQEAFRSAWRSREKFDASRATRPWLLAILRRRTVDRWRQRERQQDVASTEALEVAVPGHDPLAEEYSDEMQRALRQLPPELRETLLLVVVGELTHQETANLLQVAVGDGAQQGEPRPSAAARIPGCRSSDFLDLAKPPCLALRTCA